MGNIFCYNYTEEEEGYIRAGLVNANDLQSVQPGTYTKDGITFTLTKSVSTYYTTITITASSNSISYNAENFNRALEACGIRAQDLYTGLLSHFMDPGDTVRYGFNPDYVSAPYINMAQSATEHGEESTLTIYYSSPVVTTAYQNDPDPTGYTISDVGTIFIPLRPDNSLGAIGVVRTYCNIRPDTPNGLELNILYWPQFTTDTYDPDAGETGFKPTGAYTTNNFPGQGGRPTGSPTKKHPDYSSDTVTQPGAPDESVASVVRSGFLNVYKMSEAELNKICGALYSDTLLNAIKNMFVNPLDFIISLMIFPCTPSVSSTPTNIKFGKWDAALTGATSLGVNITGNKLSLGFGHYDFGSVSIPENWGNFLDYSQTNIELYLPFIGSVNIDVSECMGGSISVEYTIDFFTGMCVANVLCTKSITLPSGKQLGSRPAQHSFQGNCAIQIPLSAESYGSMVGSLINACTQGISNPVAGFTGIAQDAVAGGMRPNVTSKGNIVANAGFCSVLYPYVRITRPITAEPNSYQEVMGLPSYIDTSLANCTGLCVCDGIDLKGVSGATENELNRIRQMCMDGVYV